MSRMPNIYRPPTGGPLRWQDDVTGVLPAAVLAFFGAAFGRSGIDAAQIELVRDYCEYYVKAPCWDTVGKEAQFASLRERIKTMKSVEEINAWINDCLGVGLDPF